MGENSANTRSASEPASSWARQGEELPLSEGAAVRSRVGKEAPRLRAGSVLVQLDALRCPGPEVLLCRAVTVPRPLDLTLLPSQTDRGFQKRLISPFSHHKFLPLSSAFAQTTKELID